MSSSLIVSVVFALGVLLFLLLVLQRIYKPVRVTILQHQRGLLYRGGRLVQALEPGVYWATVLRQIVPVDMRKQLHQIPGQEILTSDGIAVKLSAALEYTISDPIQMMGGSNNFHGLVYSQAQAAIRVAVADLPLESLLASREAIAARLVALLSDQLLQLGAELNAARLPDIMLPSDIRRAFAQTMAAQKEGLAALERARAETASLRALANAARLMQDHPGLLQLRALQAMEAARGNTTLELKMVEPKEPAASSNSQP